MNCGRSKGTTIMTPGSVGMLLWTQKISSPQHHDYYDGSVMTQR